ncbi:hypothetical protein BZG36_05166 [Bifiguratus adelaidae]|uniref:Uncharacterized protein n=1 Tax=Bifiguratus adelaidae TaxID=1938954 RepID=A0A261XTY1_9FUNG|nr:hypothetical protein BZG36_05166 [Bifiguratus adelaidae]
MQVTDSSNVPLAGSNYSAEAGCFEGPEKLLEIWFSKCPTFIPPCSRRASVEYSAPQDDLSSLSLQDSVVVEDAHFYDKPASMERRASSVNGNGDSAVWDCNDTLLYDTRGTGLRKIDRAIWEDMLSIVKCTVLSVIGNESCDAYLLSESSMFIYPHKLILKTCGTTTLLAALPRILQIGKSMCGFEKIYRVFYSRKCYMFPHKQIGMHRKWKDEVAWLDEHFEDGSAYKVGKLNGDHWYLYLTGPAIVDDVLDGDYEVIKPFDSDEETSHEESYPATPKSMDGDTPLNTSPSMATIRAKAEAYRRSLNDQTVEILMTKLNPEAMRRFYQQGDEESGSKGGRRVDQETGIDKLYPNAMLDSFLFEPCGYSSNALLLDGYFTIHVTPEDICSYASFETTIPVEETHTHPVESIHAPGPAPRKTPLQNLITQVTNIFQPGAFSVTCFKSHPTSKAGHPARSSYTEDDLMAMSMGVVLPADGKPTVDNEVVREELRYETQSRLVKNMGIIEGYKRTDRILYEFEGYDFTFAHYKRA